MLDFLKKRFFDGFAGFILLAILAAWLRFLAFSKTDFAVGWDAYFYLINLRAWVETGKMHAPEAALVYPILRVIHSFSGSYEWSIKFGSAFLAGLFVFAVGFFSKKWGGSRAWFLPVAFAVFSPHLTWFAGQFPKNLLGASLLLFAASFFKKKTWPLVVLLVALGFFGHRLTFVLAIVWAAILLFFEKNESKKWLDGGTRRSLAPAVLVFLAAAFLLVLISKKMPGLLVFADLERLDGVFDFQKMQFAPYSFWLDLAATGVFEKWQKLELLIVLGIWAASVFRFVFDRKRLQNEGKAFILLASMLLWPFLEWSATGLALRLFSMFLLLAPLFWPIVFESEKHTTKPVVLGFYFLVLAFFSTSCFEPKTVSPDFAAFENLTKKAVEKLKTEQVELVIAHNGLAEFFEFRTRFETMPWQPEYAIDSSKLWRLAADLREPVLTYYLDNEQVTWIEKLPNGYFLMPDFVFQNLVKKARAVGDAEVLNEILTWRNPHLERPAWLLARKKNR